MLEGGEGPPRGKEPGFPRTALGALRARTTRYSHRQTRGVKGMQRHLIALAEELVHARPASEDEARAALEWIAARDGKGLAELIEERSRSRAVAS
jgi:hypothetical protein